MIKIKRLLSFVIVVMLFSTVAPSVSRADIGYSFMQISCTPSSKIMTIKVFFGGEEVLNHHEKDVYNIEAMAASPKKIIKCDLGDNEVLSLNPWFSAEHPNHNNIVIDLNDHGIARVFITQEGEFDMEVKVLGHDEATTKICPIGKNKKCKEEHLLKGKTISN